jgi:hypothetical protein
MRVRAAIVVGSVAWWGCTTDLFTAPAPDEAGVDVAPTPPDAGAADAAAPVSDADASADAAGPKFCELQVGDDAGRSVAACIDFDEPTPPDAGFNFVDLGAGTLGITNEASPSPPNHARATLPLLGTSGSGTKRIEASVPLVASATLDLDVMGSAAPLGPNQMVTYLSVTPNGMENALGAVRLVRVATGWRVTSAGGIPNLKDLPALSVLGTGWHHLRVVWTYQPMTVQLALDGKPVVTVGGFAIPDPAKITFRAGAWNETILPADPSDQVAFDSVVLRRP